MTWPHALAVAAFIVGALLVIVCAAAPARMLANTPRSVVIVVGIVLIVVSAVLPR